MKSKMIIIFIIFGFLLSGCAKTKEVNYKYGDEEMFEPFWNSNVMYNETLVMVKEGSNVPSGRLLFNATKIISVRDYTLLHEYSEDEYYYEDGQLFLTENSAIPYLTDQQIYGENLPEGYAFSTYQGKNPNSNILFTEGVGIVMHQIAVTYVHDDVWQGKTTTYLGDDLPNTISKLKSGEKLSIVLNGDSISTGANSSGKLGIEPYLDDFGTAFVKQLEKKYDTTIDFYNTSLGGSLSSWGRDNVDPNINAYNPDLVIIGFGMNDGSFEVNPVIYKENIEFMIKSIKSRNENAEIILLSTILANPISMQDKNQEDYLPILQELTNEYDGVVLVDMTNLSKEMYKTKRGVDILANNINHPSDFLVRCYVMSLLSALSE